MKKVLIATTLITSIPNVQAQNEIFAEEQNLIEGKIVEVSNRRETILKGKVVNLKKGDTLNVRQKSNADSKILFELKIGEIVTILSKESNGWYKIEKDNKEGYVNGHYIETFKETVTSEYGEATTIDAINLRKTAEWSGEKLMVISKGETVKIISKGSEWTKISYKGKEGFAPTEYLNFKNSEIREKATTTDAINLRKTAEWSGEKLMVISKGEIVEIISKGSEWTKISYKGKEGFAPTEYLKFSNSQSPSEKPNETPNNKPTETPSVTVDETDFIAKGKVIKVASNDVLNVRTQPDGDSKKVTELKPSQVVDITKKTKNGWYKVSANGKEGYVNGAYIEILKNEDIQNTQKYRTTDKVNLRSTKSWSPDAVLFTIEKNEIVNVIEKDKDWAKVSYKNNIGYIPVEYLKYDGEIEEDVAVSDKVGKIGTVNTSTLNVRSGPSTDYSVITKVYKGDTILIKEVSSNGWYKIETMSGVVGWCSGDYIDNIREGSLPSYGDTDDERLSNVLRIAKEQVGKPYVYGAEGPDSFDCSGLSYYAYKNGAGITLPRVSRDQANAGRYVSQNELKPGDLIFYNTSGNGISHLGIYIGNNEMVHAPSSGKNVEITKITSSYWTSRYVTARRIIG